MPATKAWFRRQVLELARVPPDPLPPQLQGEVRVVGIRAEVRCRPGRARRGPHRPAADRPCPSGWGRGSGPRPGRHQPAARRARVHAAASRGPLDPGAESQDERRPGRQRRSQAAASCRRPVSIGFTAMASRSRSISRNLPRRWIAVTVWPTSASCLGRGPAHGQRPRGRDRGDATSGDRRMERLGDDGQIRRFGHDLPIVAAERRVLDSPGPKWQDS